MLLGDVGPEDKGGSKADMTEWVLKSMILLSVDLSRWKDAQVENTMWVEALIL